MEDARAYYQISAWCSDPEKRPKPEDLFVSFRTPGAMEIDNGAAVDNVKQMLTTQYGMAGQIWDEPEKNP